MKNNREEQWEKWRVSWTKRDWFGTQESNRVKCRVGTQERSMCRKALVTCRGAVLETRSDLSDLSPCLHSRHELRNGTENREYLAKEWKLTAQSNKTHVRGWREVLGGGKRFIPIMVVVGGCRFWKHKLLLA